MERKSGVVIALLCFENEELGQRELEGLRGEWLRGFGTLGKVTFIEMVVEWSNDVQDSGCNLEVST